jgi:tRNA pseudouridine55 synthase
MKTKISYNDLNGFLLLDKPLGMSSNQALQRVKKLLQAKKAGHTGSLDPLATGMLPICFGEATKFARFFLEANKMYEATAQLGMRTTTGDLEGEVILQKDASGVTIEAIEAILPTFKGTTSQIPSMFSAIKYQGRPLYELAREGITIEREPRSITIDFLELITFDKAAHTFSIKVSCSKGTYIRNLMEDMGEALGVGATVIELRRLSVGHFTEAQMLSLEMLEDSTQEENITRIISLETACDALPILSLSVEEGRMIQQGKTLTWIDALTAPEYSLKVEGQKFIGIGRPFDAHTLAVSRLVAVQKEE